MTSATTRPPKVAATCIGQLPATLGAVWDRLQGGDVLLLAGGEYGHFVAGNGMVTLSGEQSTATSNETTTIIRPQDPKIVIGTNTSTNWQGYGIDTGFDDWVTVAAADAGNPPRFSSISLGSLYIPCPTTAEEPDNSKVSAECLENDGSRKAIRTLLFSEDPSPELYLRFAGVVVEDGVQIRGARHVDISNSTIQRAFDPRTDMQQSGVSTFNSIDVTINCNDISHSPYGIQVSSKQTRITNNEIHHNAHDGISITGGRDLLIEGNTIHDLDDGIGDNDLVCIPTTARDGVYKSGDHLLPGIYTVNKDDSSLTANSDYDGKTDKCNTFDTSGNCCTKHTWNMHTDGMQMYTVGWVNSKFAEDVRNVVFRGNLIYNYEAMGVMINGNAVGVYSNFIFENNIFGPAGGYLFILGAGFEERLIFRNNTVLYAPDNEWVSIFNRHMHGQNYFVQTWNGSLDLPHYQFYNNILDVNSIFGDTYSSGHNIYLGSSWKTPTDTDLKIDQEQSGIYRMNGTISEQVASGITPGELLPGSPAIDFGTTSMNALSLGRARANLGNNQDGPAYQVRNDKLTSMANYDTVITTHGNTAANLQARPNCTTEERSILAQVEATATASHLRAQQVRSHSLRVGTVATASLALKEAREIIEVNQELITLRKIAETAMKEANALASSSPNRADMITVATALYNDLDDLRDEIKSVRKASFQVANNRSALEDSLPSLPMHDQAGQPRKAGDAVDAGALERTAD